ncbi:microtubule-associated proteins 1A/1B light chain 3C [Etheostoma cragini]|uniref:microtubule-associated proteins 1A/1B light chain 3C n=1 Tax=Etheostoma cragini TaxID=417921 RepID=UPI00155F2802|nr:microtubule-associated proteins 1A/1B light chain 3C [Etheostoma cragini]
MCECAFTLPTRTRSVSLFVGVPFQLLPAPSPIKHQRPEQLSGVLLTSTRGDFTVSPGKTAVPPPTPLACKPPRATNMAPFEKSMEMMPFKQRKCLETRKDEVCSIRTKFPNKLPVIVERYLREKTLPLLDKTKFLVPFELTLGQFLCLLRNKIALDSTQALFLLVAEKSMSCMSSSMGEVYSRYSDTDGFLYITYASQEMFGAPQTSTGRPC